MLPTAVGSKTGEPPTPGHQLNNPFIGLASERASASRAEHSCLGATKKSLVLGGAFTKTKRPAQPSLGSGGEIAAGVDVRVTRDILLFIDHLAGRDGVHE